MSLLHRNKQFIAM